MKVVIEKEEANIIRFDPNTEYPVFKDFVFYEIIGFAKISIENGVLCAELDLRVDITGYPSILYVNVNETGTKCLEAVSINDEPNLDESISIINYKKE